MNLNLTIAMMDVSRFKCTGRNSLGISEKTITVHITGSTILTVEELKLNIHFFLFIDAFPKF